MVGMVTELRECPDTIGVMVQTIWRDDNTHIRVDRRQMRRQTSILSVSPFGVRDTPAAAAIPVLALLAGRRGSGRSKFINASAWSDIGRVETSHNTEGNRVRVRRGVFPPTGWSGSCLLLLETSGGGWWRWWGNGSVFSSLEEWVSESDSKTTSHGEERGRGWGPER
jgi:hypothetical protein